LLSTVIAESGFGAAPLKLNKALLVFDIIGADGREVPPQTLPA
jgi:hypothetical protein